MSSPRVQARIHEGLPAEARTAERAPLRAGPAVGRVTHTILSVLLALTAARSTFAEAPPAARPGPELLDKIGISPQLGEQLPVELEFIDSSGKSVRLSEYLDGKPLILHLVYYDCPMLCKLSSDGLFTAVENLALRLGEDYTIVTVSFDPREGPELAARARELAAERCGRELVERGWHFLSGDEAAIERLTAAVGFRYAYDAASRQYAHAAGLFVVTPGGKVSRYLSGIRYSQRDLRLSLVEASGGKIGTATDQVLLLCYMYDPSSGKYGLAILAVLRGAGLLTVGGLAVAIVTMLRRERRSAGADLDFPPELASNDSAPGGTAGPATDDRW